MTNHIKSKTNLSTKQAECQEIMEAASIQLQKYNRPMLFYGTAVLVPWLCWLIWAWLSTVNGGKIGQ
jgi:hypothetical protein